MFQTVGQSTQPPMAQFQPIQTMASAAASHLPQQQQQQQQRHQYQMTAEVAALAQQQRHHQTQMPAQQTSQQSNMPSVAQHASADHVTNATGTVPVNPVMTMAASAIAGQQIAAKRVVKWVFSGDYLVLRDHPRGGPPPEYYINLAYVQAPRFNRTPSDDSKTSLSEPYAWEAKDYLARRLIGQEVVYRSEYTKPGSAPAGGAGAGPFAGNANKEFGIIYLGDENIVETMVSEGLLEVRRAKTESPVLQRLIEVEEAAKEAGKGKWSSEPAPKHELLHEHPNPNQLKGKTFTGSVENVRNGGAIQVYLDLGVEQGVHKHLNASIMVSGIRSPDKNRANEAKFFEESKFFTESRLLNREVKVTIEKIERNSFLASVQLNQNNLAEALLRQGMARCNDASISVVKAPEKLRAAEKEAKAKRLRIWENYVDSRGDGPSEVYEAKIVEIISGDSMMAQNIATGEVKKIFLASIRLGAPVDRDRQRDAKVQEESTDAATKGAKGESKQAKTPAQPVAAEANKSSSIPRIYDNPILYHARELLRRKLLGKKALVKVEYVQPKSDSYPEKICCTVRPADQPKWNAAEALVSKGYASVMKYFSDDSQRASNFDELLKAEQTAQKSRESKDDKSKDMNLLKVVDLCNDATRSKQLLPFLSRSRKDAIIEFVFSASRFKVFLPKENNTLLNLVLAGVMVPREPESIRNASTAAAKSLVHQRDVSIQINNIDKKGNFIGWIFYKDEETNKETSINLQLVKLGFGQVRDSSASSNLGDLKAAENVAREKKLGMWLNYQEPKRREEEVGNAQDDTNDVEEETTATTNGVSSAKSAANKEAELLKNRKPVIVTNSQIREKSVIVSVQSVESGPKLEELLKQMRAELPAGGKKKGSGGASNEAYTPAKGEIVAAKFSVDHQWYRAKVLRVNSPQDIEIVFIDYGNLEKVRAKDLAKLSTKFTSQEAFAKDYVLAFVEATTHDLDWVEESRRAFMELVYGQVLMRVEYKDVTTNMDAVTLVDESTKTDIGKKLVESGLLIACKRRERKLIRTINDYLHAEKTAKENRANMWQYGDFTADDAREFGFRSAAA